MRLGTRTSVDLHYAENTSDEIVTHNTVLAIPTALACVKLLAGTQATLPLVVYRPKGDSREVAYDHWLYRIIHDDPNADQTASDFWEYICVSLELTGDGFAEKLRGSGGQIVGLDPIPPSIVSVTRLPSGEIEYRWSWEGKTRIETSENVLHIRGFGGDPLGGMSTLQFGADAFGQARSLNRTSGNVLKNAARPSGILQTDFPLTTTQVQEAEALLLDKYRGATNAGRPMILGHGLKWQQLTMTPEDLQMLESKAFSVEEICRIFGTPPHMVGHTAGNTQLGSSITEQTRAFEKFTLRQRLRKIQQAVRKQLLTPDDIGRGIQIEFNMEGLLQGSPTERAAFYGSGLDKGWMTINEVRAKENMPPVAGGDVPRVQMQNMPLTLTSAPSTINALPAPAE